MARASGKRRDEASGQPDESGVHRRATGRRPAKALAGERATAAKSKSGPTGVNAKSRVEAGRSAKNEPRIRRLPARKSAPPPPPDTGNNRRLAAKLNKSGAGKEREARVRVSLRVRLIEARASGRQLWLRVRRPLVFAGRLSMVLALCAAAVAIGRLVERHVRTSSAFAIQEISVAGIERLTREEAIAAAGLAMGQNVFDRAPEEAEVALSNHPWVASARVTRRLPGSFDISVREHHPVAVLSLLAVDDSPTRLFLVAEDGTVFKEVDAGDPTDLPVVTGLDHARFASDSAFRASIVLEVVALLHDFRGAGLFRREPISEIHIESDDSLSLYVGDDAMNVRLGRGPYRQKLSRLRRVLDRLRREETRAAYVYLDNVRRPDRVTVRLRD